MFGQVCLLGEGGMTLVALEGSLARVNAQVVHEVVPLVEDLVLSVAAVMSALKVSH